MSALRALLMITVRNAGTSVPNSNNLYYEHPHPYDNYCLQHENSHFNGPSWNSHSQQLVYNIKSWDDWTILIYKDQSVYFDQYKGQNVFESFMIEVNFRTQGGSEKLSYDEQTDENQNPLNKEDKDLINVEFAAVLYHVAALIKSKTFCWHCKQEFASGNLLHKHLKSCPSCKRPAADHTNKKTKTIILKVQKEVTVTDSPVEDSIIDSTSTSPALKAKKAPSIIQSSALRNFNGMIFHNWHFCMMNVSFELKGIAALVCVNTDCTMSLIDQAFLKKMRPDIKVKHLTKVIPLREIGAAKHLSDKWVVLDLYIQGYIDKLPAITYLTKEVHLVNNLKAKMLMGTNILVTKGAVVDLSQQKMFLSTCKNIVVPI